MWHLPWQHWNWQQWNQGTLFPLWNDQLGLGMNWPGQGTSTVFYPGTWLLAILPGSFLARYSLLIGIHVLLAGCNCFLAARRLNVGQQSAVLAAVAYSLSGPVLIQHANWPFLVSAAWLPLVAVGLWDCLSRKNNGLTMAVLGMSMMILGGDPQTAYTMALLAGLGTLLRVFPGNGEDRYLRRILRQGSRLAIVCSLAGACSMVQLTASWDAAAQSSRSLEQPSTVAGEEANSVIANRNTQDWQRLRFSQAPWTTVTLVSGNVLGTWRDYNRRWEQLIPAAEQAWNPTLYMGLIPFLLALATFRRRDLGSQLRPGDSASPVRWLQLVVLLAGLGSFGWYGLGWLAAELGWLSLGNRSGWYPQTGGLYWIIQWCIPGYDQFRYPGKLWQPAGLSLCLLAAIAWEYRLSCSPARQAQLGRWLLLPSILLLCLGFAAVVHPWGGQWVLNQFQQPHVDRWLGALRPNLALHELQMALFQSLVVAALGTGILAISSRILRSDPRLENLPLPRLSPAAQTLALTLLVLLDVSIANSWLLMTTDRHCLDLETTLVPPSPGEPAAQQVSNLTRIMFQPAAMEQHLADQRQIKWGPQWPSRPADKLAWQAMRSMRAAYCPQLHLLPGPTVGILNADTTLRPAYLDVLQHQITKRSQGEDQERQQSLLGNFRTRLGITHSLETVPAEDGNQRRPAYQLTPTAPTQQVWFAEKWTALPSPARTLSAFEKDATEVWWKPVSNGVPQTEVIVEHPLPGEVTAGAGTVIKYDFVNRSAEIETTAPSFLCWNMNYDSGWSCELTGSDGQRELIQPVAVNRIQMGVVVPAGNYHVSWHYQPWWWTWGWPVTLLGWLGFGAVRWATGRAAS